MSAVMNKQPPVFLLCGPEAGEKKEKIKAIKKDLAKAAGEPPEEQKFFAFDTPAAEVLSYLRNGSLFALHKLVLIEQVETYKKAELKLLAEYSKNPAPATTLLLLTEKTRTDSPLDRALPKGAVLIFWEMFENKKRDWVRNYFRRSKRGITPDAVEFLLEMVPNDTESLKKECEKLLLFLPEETTVTEDELEDYLYHEKEENVFTLFERILKKDFPGSLEVTQNILLSGENEGVRLMSGLLWQFQKLKAVQEGLKGGLALDEACRKAGVSGKKNRARYGQGVRQFNPKAMRRIIALIADYDLQIKQTPRNRQESRFQTFLYSVINKNGAPLSREE